MKKRKDTVAMGAPEPVERPPYPPVGGLTYAQGPHVTYGKIFWARAECADVYDGCCSVR